LIWHRGDVIIWRFVAGINGGIGCPMASLDCIVFVRRQSPDWEALTRDHEAGIHIDPCRYIPDTEIPGFPNDIAACIQAWNNTFSMNFFRCRQTLKNISEHSVRQVRNSIFITQDKIGELPSLVAGARFLLFFFDDDDWFAPDIFERLAALDLGRCDIAVFPLIRLGDRIFTFVRDDESACVTVGPRRHFDHRFQTNNYGISSQLASPGILHNLRDHVLGSCYADEQNFRDKYFDVLISATNKTPCSANTIGALLTDPRAYRAGIGHYVNNLQQLDLPPPVGWMAEPVGETVKLFSTV
jgi:hypothetical protein